MKKTPKKMTSPKRSRKSAALEPEVLGPEDESSENQGEDQEFDPDQETPDEKEIQASVPAEVEPESSDGGGIAPGYEPTVSGGGASDPLQRYLQEVRRYPLLSSEEELRLALRIRDQGDLDAAKILVSANLRLVVKIAMEYRSIYSNLLDLIQEGNIGLMKAVSKFDSTKGARLGYYASWWIRSYMLKYLLDNFRLVKIGTTQAQKKLFYHLSREKERLEAQGLLAGPKLLAEKLNVREKDVVEMQQRLSGGGAEVSLDTPLHGNDSEEGSHSSHMDFLADSAESADEKLARDQLLSMLHERLPEFEKQLNEKELKLLQERLLAEEPKTLQQVADQYGLTRERARQIEAKLVLKLRDFLKLED